MKGPASIRHLKIAVILVLSVLVLGTAGYMLIEQLSFVDALYTTVDMMATVGSTAHPFSVGGKLFNIAVIVLGVGSLLYTFGAGMEFMIEGHLSTAIRRHLILLVGTRWQVWTCCQTEKRGQHVYLLYLARNASRRACRA